MIAIPNMEKPKDCRHCPRRIQYDDGWSVRDKCLELNRNINYKYGDQVVMQNDCPLIEIDDTVWENEKYKLIRMTQEARFNKAMAERRADDVRHNEQQDF